ncbi:MAG: transporter substrate-binding domain-containing protein [Emcibacteraceae bacterium]|nr:transporter substrate-binding domain-containing protein [Emcibacteraceae bacterium]MDG1857743.1 transporter substrate-binding domain-containing protein [Emcibacteraceae bacterium]
MKIIKAVYFTAVFLVSILCSSLSYAQEEDFGTVLLSDAEKTWLEQHPVITASNELEWAPLDFVRNGEPLGFSIDYLNLVAEKVGLKIEYINGYSWEELLEKLENREIDMAQSIIQDAERAKYLNFTKPYLDLPMVYFGREGSSRINSIKDLEGLRIGVVQGSIPASIYQDQYSHLNLVNFDSTHVALKSLSAGAIDVHADILPVSRYMIRTNLLPGIEGVLNPFEQIQGESDLNEEGTGLGLSIVQKLVELHGGKFSLESQFKKGTTATITLRSKRISY